MFIKEAKIRVGKELIAVILCAYILFIHAPIVAERAKESNVPSKLNTGNVLEGDWSSIKTAYFTIYYKPEVNLGRVERKISRRRFYVDTGYNPRRSSSTEEKVAHKIDILFKRAQEILDMRPRNMHPNIKIFKTQGELNDAYYKIFRTREKPISFYVYKHDTIYTCEESISDSVIAHEMGHAIVDHYFVILPPERVKEILAQYVDKHLDS